MITRQLFDQETSTFTYLLACEQTLKAVLIDPVDTQYQRDLKLLRELGLELTATIETHVHADHITGSALLHEHTGSAIMVPAGSNVLGANQYLKEGDQVFFGLQHLVVLETPGHTANSISLLQENIAVFTGDTLLIRGTGRTDFQGGDSTKLYRSITQKLFSLPDHIRVYPGHDYRGFSQSTIAEEKVHNPRLADKTEAAFVTIMENLKLALPKRIHDAVPANRICGNVLDGGMEVSPQWVHEQNNGLVLIDVRGRAEYEGSVGHIQSAILLETNLEDMVKQFTNALVVTICRSGKRSLDAAHRLRSLGCHQVWSMRGGMMAWHDQRLPYSIGVSS